MRGSNQSADTKYATVLISKAVALIQSGRVNKGAENLSRALTLLPYIGTPEQIEAEEASKGRIKRLAGEIWDA